jgi:hypothetical protein
MRGLICTASARRRPFAVALMLAALPVLSGCGGSSDNGVASKSAAEIVAASKAAAAGASSVRIRAKNTQGRLVATLHLDLSRAGSSAQVTTPEGNFELIRVGETLYVKGDARFYRTLALSAPAGTWVRASKGDPKVGALAGFTEVGSEVANLLTASGPLSKGGHKTVNGQKAIELKQTTKVFVGALFVATTGKPYPIAALKKGLVSGAVTFSEWNKPVSVTAPAKAIDIAQATPAG